MQLGLEDAGTELDLPEDFEAPALVVVVETGEDDAGGFPRTGRLLGLLDEVLTMADLDDVADFGPDAADTRGSRRGRSTGIGEVARGFEKPGEEGGPGSAGVVEPVSAARGAQLVAAEETEQAGEVKAGRGGIRSGPL